MRKNIDNWWDEQLIFGLSRSEVVLIAAIFLTAILIFPPDMDCVFGYRSK